MNTDFLNQNLRNGVKNARAEWLKNLGLRILYAMAWILFFVILAVINHFYGPAIPVGLVIGISGVLSVFLWHQKRKARVALESMTAEELVDYQALCKELEIEKPFGDLEESELNWVGKSLDVVLGVASFAGPPLVLKLIRGKSLTWDTPVTGWDVLTAICTCLLYLLIRKKLLNRFIV